MPGMSQDGSMASNSIKVVSGLAADAAKVGSNNIEFKVIQNGRPLAGLTWAATVSMTSMDMGTTHPAVKDIGKGSYSTAAVFGMQGPWKLVLTSKIDGKSFTQDFLYQAGGKAPPMADKNAPLDSMSSMKSGALVPKVIKFSPDAIYGFGQNAPMVGMMNMMMVGGSPMESMKMAPMQMSFGPENFKGDVSNTSNMGGITKTGSMKGMQGTKDMATKPMQMPMASANSSSSNTSPEMDSQSMTGQMDVSSQKVTLLAHFESGPKVGSNMVHVHVTGANGKPVDGYKIALTSAMVEMDMGTEHPVAKRVAPGHYEATVTFSMAGKWAITVKATKKGSPTVIKSFTFSAKN